MHFGQRASALLLLGAVALAGCLEPDEAAGDAPPAPPTGGSPLRSLGSFLIDGPTLTTPDGRIAPFHEDDRLLVRWQLRVPPEGETSTGFVTLFVNGDIAQTHNVRIEPGDSRAFEHRIDDLRNHTEVAVEIRIRSEQAAETAEVRAWPRVGERRDVDGLVATVHTWARDEANGTTRVNATFETAGPAFSTLRVKLLCADASGRIHERGYEEPGIPRPGSPVAARLALPLCAADEVTYGIQATTRDEGHEEAARVRVLFVPPGWRPPES